MSVHSARVTCPTIKIKQESYIIKIVKKLEPLSCNKICKTIFNKVCCVCSVGFPLNYVCIYDFDNNIVQMYLLKFVNKVTNILKGNSTINISRLNVMGEELNIPHDIIISFKNNQSVHRIRIKSILRHKAIINIELIGYNKFISKIN